MVIGIILDTVLAIVAAMVIAKTMRGDSPLLEEVKDESACSR